jgi:hypothetical protein
MAVIRGFESRLRVGHDGLSVGGGEDVSHSADMIRVELPRKAHAYDIRKKKYLGYTSHIDTIIECGGNNLFALLPYKVNGIELQVPGKVSAGGDMEIRFRMLTEKPDAEYANVASINVYDPSGEHIWLYSENISFTGDWVNRKYDIPFNEKPGIWKLVIKDVATGVTTEKEFEVL